MEDKSLSFKGFETFSSFVSRTYFDGKSYFAISLPDVLKMDKEMGKLWSVRM